MGSTSLMSDLLTFYDTYFSICKTPIIETYVLIIKTIIIFYFWNIITKYNNSYHLFTNMEINDNVLMLEKL